MANCRRTKATGSARAHDSERRSQYPETSSAASGRPTACSARMRAPSRSYAGTCLPGTSGRYVPSADGLLPIQKLTPPCDVVGRKPPPSAAFREATARSGNDSPSNNRATPPQRQHPPFTGLFAPREQEQKRHDEQHVLAQQSEKRSDEPDREPGRKPIARASLQEEKEQQTDRRDGEALFHQLHVVEPERRVEREEPDRWRRRRAGRRAASPARTRAQQPRTATAICSR